MPFHPGERVRLVRLIGVAAPVLLLMVGRVGEVRRGWWRDGAQRVEVAFVVLDRGSRDVYTFSAEELELVTETVEAAEEVATQAKRWRTGRRTEERDDGEC